MPGTKRLAALLALLAAAATLSACGSDEVSGEIPADDAVELNAALDDVNAAIASGNCEEATSEVERFLAGVDLLPLDAGKELKDELRAAGNHLGTLVETECAPTEAPATTQSTTTTTTTSIPTETSTTETSTTETSSSTTTSTDEPSPPGNGNGGGPPDGVPPGGDGDGGTGGTGDEKTGGRR